MDAECAAHVDLVRKKVFKIRMIWSGILAVAHATMMLVLSYLSLLNRYFAILMIVSMTVGLANESRVLRSCLGRRELKIASQLPDLL